MSPLALIIFFVSIIIAVVIVSKAQQLYMRIIGANAMFFSGAKKLGAIVVVAIIVFGLLARLFKLA